MLGQMPAAGGAVGEGDTIPGAASRFPGRDGTGARELMRLLLDRGVGGGDSRLRTRSADEGGSAEPPQDTADPIPSGSG